MKLTSVLLTAGLCGSAVSQLVVPFVVPLVPTPRTTKSPTATTTTTTFKILEPKPTVTAVTHTAFESLLLRRHRRRAKAAEAVEAAERKKIPRPPTLTATKPGPPLLIGGDNSSTSLSPIPDDPKFKVSSDNKEVNDPFLRQYWAMRPILNEYMESCQHLNVNHVSELPVRCQELRNLIALGHIAQGEFKLPPIGWPKPPGWTKIIIYNREGRAIGDMPMRLPAVYDDLLLGYRPTVTKSSRATPPSSSM